MTTAGTADTIGVESSSGSRSTDQAGANIKTKSELTINSEKQRLNDKEKDYIFFAKAILEKVPLHGKNECLLLIQ